MKDLRRSVGSSTSKCGFIRVPYISILRNDNWVILLVIVSVFVKAVVGTLNPLGADFLNLLFASCFSDSSFHLFGVYTSSIYILNMFYRLWLLMPIKHLPLSEMLGHDYFNISFSSFLLVFMMKLPLLICDLFVGLFTYRVMLASDSSKRLAQAGLLLWLLNPYNTIAIEMDAKMDIVSVLFVIASVYCFMKNKKFLSGICLAVGTILRFYPLLLFPFYAAILARRREFKALTTLTSSFVGMMFIVVFSFIAYLKLDLSWFIDNVVLSGNKEFLWFFGANISTMSSTDVSLSLVVTLYTIYVFIIYRLYRPSDEVIVYGILCALLTFIGFSHWNAGYPMWVTPFLTIHYVTESSVNKKRTNAILFGLFFASLFAYNVFSWWHALVFSWTPYYNQQIRTIVEFLSATTVALNVGGFATSLSQSILAAVCTIYILLCVRIMLRRKSHGPISSGDSRLGCQRISSHGYLNSVFNTILISLVKPVTRKAIRSMSSKSEPAGGSGENFDDLNSSIQSEVLVPV